MYNLITIAQGSDDLSIGFDLSRCNRQQQLTKNKRIKGKHHVWFMLQEKLDMLSDINEHA